MADVDGRNGEAATSGAGSTPAERTDGADRARTDGGTPAVLVVDGSNLARGHQNTSARPSWTTLRSALDALRARFPDGQIIPIVGPAFARTLNNAEQRRFEQEGAAYGVVHIPDRLIADNDSFFLSEAEERGGAVVSNDAFRDQVRRFQFLAESGRLLSATSVAGRWRFDPVRPGNPAPATSTSPTNQAGQAGTAKQPQQQARSGPTGPATTGPVATPRPGGQGGGKHPGRRPHQPARHGEGAAESAAAASADQGPARPTNPVPAPATAEPASEPAATPVTTGPAATVEPAPDAAGPVTVTTGGATAEPIADLPDRQPDPVLVDLVELASVTDLTDGPRRLDAESVRRIIADLQQRVPMGATAHEVMAALATSVEFPIGTAVTVGRMAMFLRSRACPSGGRPMPDAIRAALDGVALEWTQTPSIGEALLVRCATVPMRPLDACGEASARRNGTHPAPVAVTDTADDRHDDPSGADGPGHPAVEVVTEPPARTEGEPAVGTAIGVEPVVVVTDAADHGTSAEVVLAPADGDPAGGDGREGDVPDTTGTVAPTGATEEAPEASDDPASGLVRRFAELALDPWQGTAAVDALVRAAVAERLLPEGVVVHLADLVAALPAPDAPAGDDPGAPPAIDRITMFAALLQAACSPTGPLAVGSDDRGPWVTRRTLTPSPRATAEHAARRVLSFSELAPLRDELTRRLPKGSPVRAALEVLAVSRTWEPFRAWRLGDLSQVLDALGVDGADPFAHVFRSELTGLPFMVELNEPYLPVLTRLEAPLAPAPSQRPLPPPAGPPIGGDPG